MKVVAVDSGRRFTKVAAEGMDPFLFPSVVGAYHKREYKEDLPDDIEMHYNGESYFIGQLAEREAYNYYQNYDESKVTKENLNLTLAAIFRTGVEGPVSLVTGVPIGKYTKEERKGLRDMLRGEHEVEINGVRRTIDIAKVMITMEAGAAFFAHYRPGTVRILDLGSRMWNAATFKDGVFIDRESSSIDLGCEMLGKDKGISEVQIQAAADAVNGGVKKLRWKEGDTVIMIGGGAEGFYPYVQNYFPNAEVLSNSIYSNVEGYLAAGRARR